LARSDLRLYEEPGDLPMGGYSDRKARERKDVSKRVEIEEEKPRMI